MATVKKSLRLNFEDSEKNKHSVSFSDVLDNLSTSTVTAAANAFVTNNAALKKDFAKAVSAELISTSTTTVKFA